MPCHTLDVFHEGNVKSSDAAYLWQAQYALSNSLFVETVTTASFAAFGCCEKLFSTCLSICYRGDL